MINSALLAKLERYVQEHYAEKTLPLKLTPSDVEKHNTKDDCWVIMEGKVYDVTIYFPLHPGGVKLLFQHAGRDCTADFTGMFHSMRAREILTKMYIGDIIGVKHFSLKPFSVVGMTPPKTLSSSKPFTSKLVAKSSNPVLPPLFPPPTIKDFESTLPPLAPSFSNTTSTSFSSYTIIPSEFREFILTSRRTISPDTQVFRFLLNLPPFSPLDLPITHIRIKHPLTGEIKNYTPILSHHQSGSGYFDLLVKGYPNGNISKFLHSLTIGDFIFASGPFETIKLEVLISPLLLSQTPILMLAAGTGITPMFQILKKLYTNYDKEWNCTLVFANRNEEDILLREDLDGIGNTSPNIKLHYFLSGKTKSLESGKIIHGRVTELWLKNNVFQSCPNLFTLCCGPKGFNESMEKILFDNGYSPDKIHIFY